MKLYNSLSHTKEEFVPHVPGKVSMYTCGPTVYHFAHIGNLRSYIMEEVLEKFLRYDGYEDVYKRQTWWWWTRWPPSPPVLRSRATWATPTWACWPGS